MGADDTMGGFLLPDDFEADREMLEKLNRAVLPRIELAFKPKDLGLDEATVTTLAQASQEVRDDVLLRQRKAYYDAIAEMSKKLEKRQDLYQGEWKNAAEVSNVKWRPAAGDPRRGYATVSPLPNITFQESDRPASDVDDAQRSWVSMGSYRGSIVFQGDDLRIGILAGGTMETKQEPKEYAELHDGDLTSIEGAKADQERVLRALWRAEELVQLVSQPRQESLSPLDWSLEIFRRQSKLVEVYNEEGAWLVDLVRVNAERDDLPLELEATLATIVAAGEYVAAVNQPTTTQTRMDDWKRERGFLLGQLVDTALYRLELIGDDDENPYHPENYEIEITEYGDDDDDD